MGLLSSHAPPEQKIKGSLVDVDATTKEALDMAQKGWELSDQDFASRFPGMVQTRDANLQTAKDQLAGPSALEQESFLNRGLASSMGAFGSGTDYGSTFQGGGDFGQPSGIGRNTAAADVGTQAENYQDNARNYVQQLIGQNPEREFLPEDFRLQLGLANTDQANQLISAKQQADYMHQVAVQQASQATTQAYAGIFARL